MRRIHAPSRRLSALTAPLTSPFFHQIDPSESAVRPLKGTASRKSGTGAQTAGQEFLNASIRTRRSLW